MNKIYYKTIPFIFDSMNEYVSNFETFLRLEIKALIKKEMK